MKVIMRKQEESRKVRFIRINYATGLCIHRAKAFHDLHKIERLRQNACHTLRSESTFGQKKRGGLGRRVCE